MESNYNPIIAIIQFQVNNKQEQIKIHKNDSIELVAKNFCKEYSLKQEKYRDIEQLIISEIEKNKKKQQIAQRQIVLESNLSTKTSFIKTREKTSPEYQQQKSEKPITPPSPVNYEAILKHDNSEVLQSKYEKWSNRIKQKQYEQEQKKYQIRSFSAKQNPILTNHISPKLQKTEQIQQQAQSTESIPNLSVKQITQKSSPMPISNNPTHQTKKNSALVKTIQKETVSQSLHSKSPSLKTEKQFLQRMAVNQVKKEQHLQNLRYKNVDSIISKILFIIFRREYNKNQDNYTGQSLFQPVITKDDIYWTVKSKQDKEDLEIVNEMGSQKQNKQILDSTYLQKQFTDKKETLFQFKIEKLSKEQLEVIFRQMDNNNDGYISYDYIELTGIAEYDLNIIKEVLFDMEDNNQRLNLHQFLTACNEKGIMEPQTQRFQNFNSKSIHKNQISTSQQKQVQNSTQEQPLKRQIEILEKEFDQLPSKYQKLINKYKDQIG